MHRRDVLKAIGSLAVTPALGGFARASAQGQEGDTPLPDLIRKLGPMMNTVPIEVARLNTGLSLVTGPGGNVTALTGPDGIVMVDAFVPNRGAELAEVVRKLGEGPIALINTHWHFDHAGGNAALAAIGAKIIAHQNTRTRLSSEQYNEAFQMKSEPAPSAALPIVTFGDSATLYLNGEEIHLQHVAPAHTDGDIFIHYRKANVLQTGDLFSNGFYPNVDGSSGGWIGGMVAAADLLLDVADAKTKIVPGHGPLATRDDLKAARDMLSEVSDKIQPLFEAGKTVVEAVAAKPLAKLDTRWGKGLFKGSHFIRIIYVGLASHRDKK